METERGLSGKEILRFVGIIALTILCVSLICGFFLVVFDIMPKVRNEDVFVNYWGHTAWLDYDMSKRILVLIASVIISLMPLLHHEVRWMQSLPPLTHGDDLEGLL